MQLQTYIYRQQLKYKCDCLVDKVQTLDMSTAASPLQRISESDGYIYMDRKYMPRQSQLSGSELGMTPRPVQLLDSTSSNPDVVSKLQELALQPGDEDEGQTEDAGGKCGKDGSCSGVSGEGDSENTETVLPHPTVQPQQFQQRQLLMQMKGLKQPPKLDEDHSEDESSEFDDDLDDDLDDEYHSEDETIEFDDDFYDDPRALMTPIQPTGGRGDRNAGNVGSNKVRMLPQQMRTTMMPNMRTPSIPGVGQIAMPLPPAQQVSMARRPPNIRSPGIPPMVQTSDMPPQQLGMSMATRPTIMDGAIFPNIGQMGRMPPPQHNDMNMIRTNNMLAGASFPGMEQKGGIMPPQQYVGTMRPNMMHSAGFPRTGHHMSSTPMSHHLPMGSIQAPGLYAPGTEKLQVQAAATTGNLMAQQQSMALIQRQQQQQQQQVILNGHAHGYGGPTPNRRSCSCVFSFFCCA